MFDKALIAAAAGLAAATPAYAQDTADASRYAGPRAELRLGFEFVGSGVQDDQSFGDRGSFGDDSSGEDVFVGVEIGYDHPLGSRIVAGVYAGLEFTDTRLGSAGGRPYNVETGRNFTLGGRVGVPLSTDAMIYGKAGYSHGKLDVEFLPGSDPTLFDDYDSDRSGFHVGGGAEIPVLSRAYGRVEYVFSKYERFDAGSTLELPFTRHQLVAALGMRF